MAPMFDDLIRRDPRDSDLAGILGTPIRALHRWLSSVETALAAELAIPIQTGPNPAKFSARPNRLQRASQNARGSVVKGQTIAAAICRAMSIIARGFTI
jgi:hypothetical protein